MRLSPTPIAFAPADSVDDLEEVDGRVVLAVTEPAVVEGVLAVTTSIYCGELCAAVGANTLTQDPTDGTWTVGPPVGLQVVS